MRASASTHHRAELQHRERAARPPDPLLAEQHRAAAREPDGEGDPEQDQRAERQQRGGDQTSNARLTTAGCRVSPRRRTSSADPAPRTSDVERRTGQLEQSRNERDLHVELVERTQQGDDLGVVDHGRREDDVLDPVVHEELAEGAERLGIAELLGRDPPLDAATAAGQPIDRAPDPGGPLEVADHQVALRRDVPTAAHARYRGTAAARRRARARRQRRARRPGGLHDPPADERRQQHQRRRHLDLARDVVERAPAQPATRAAVQAEGAGRTTAAGCVRIASGRRTAPKISWTTMPSAAATAAASARPSGARMVSRRAGEGAPRRDEPAIRASGGGRPGGHPARGGLRRTLREERAALVRGQFWRRRWGKPAARGGTGPCAELQWELMQ